MLRTKAKPVKCSNCGKEFPWYELAAFTNDDGSKNYRYCSNCASEVLFKEQGNYQVKRNKGVYCVLRRLEKYYLAYEECINALPDCENCRIACREMVVNRKPCDECRDKFICWTEK